MRGGSYKTDKGGKNRQRLNRKTGQWEPCDDQGNVPSAEHVAGPDLVVGTGPEIESSTEEE